MSKVAEWYKTNRPKFKSDEEAVTKCCRQFKIGKDKVIKKIQRATTTLINKVSKMQTSYGLSESELRSKHDVLYKIERAAKDIPPSRFIPEIEFRSTMANVDATKFRAKADLPQFDKFKGRVGGVIYWGRPELIKKLKDEGVLQ